VGKFKCVLGNVDGGGVLKESVGGGGAGVCVENRL
jgi:hypothetical protein